MEIRNIVTFLKVAGTQNFSKAAEQLGYSQSAVTVQIQQLENMKVTNRALDFSKKNSVPRGELKIGGVESICTALLPDLILKLHKICPEIEIVIKSGKTADLLEMAKGNDLDLIFTLDQKICNPEWTCAMQRTEEIIFVTLGKEMTEKREVQIQELIQEPFLLTERGAAYHYELERLLSERDLRISPVLEIGNTETIINLLKRGMGVSFLPEFTVRKELKRGKLMQIDTDLPGVKMYSQLLYYKNKWVTPQMQAFIDMVKGERTH